MSKSSFANSESAEKLPKRLNNEQAFFLDQQFIVRQAYMDTKFQPQMSPFTIQRLASLPLGNPQAGIIFSSDDLNPYEEKYKDLNRQIEVVHHLEEYKESRDNVYFVMQNMKL